MYDVSPPGGPGVLASFLWNDDAFELLNKVGRLAGWVGGWVGGRTSGPGGPSASTAHPLARSLRSLPARVPPTATPLLAPAATALPRTAGLRGLPADGPGNLGLLPRRLPRGCHQMHQLHHCGLAQSAVHWGRLHLLHDARGVDLPAGCLLQALRAHPLVGGGSRPACPALVWFGLVWSGPALPCPDSPAWHPARACTARWVDAPGAPEPRCHCGCRSLLSPPVCVHPHR